MSLTDVFTWCLCVFDRCLYVVVVRLPHIYFTSWPCVFDRCFYVVIVSSTDVFMWCLCL